MMKITFLVFLLITGLLARAQQPSYNALKQKITHAETKNKKAEALRALSQFYIYKPDELKIHLDSAKIFAERAMRISISTKDIKGQGLSYLLYAQIEREGDNIKGGMAIVNKVIDLARENKLVALEGEAYVEFSNYFGWGKEQPIRIQHLEKAVSLFRIEGTKKQLAYSLTSLAEQRTNVSEFRMAINEGNEALKLYKEINEPVDLQELHNLLGISYTRIGLFEKGINESLLAAKSGDKKGDTSLQMATIYNNIGLAHYYDKNYKEAVKYHYKSLELAKKNNDQNSIHVVANNIVNDLVYEGKPREAKAFLLNIIKTQPIEGVEELVLDKVGLLTIYQALKEPNQVGKFTLELLEIKRKHASEMRRSVVYNINSKAIKHFYDRKEFGKAKMYLSENVQMANQAEDKPFIKLNHWWQFKLDSISGNYRSAFKHYEMFTSMNEQELGQKRQFQLGQLQLEYEIEKKDNELFQKGKNIELLTQQGKLQRAKLDNDRILKIIILSVSGLLLVIAILLYYSFYMRKRSNRLLEIKQNEIEKKNNSLEELVEEKQWLLREIHHRVKNNLQIVMSLLNSQSAFLTDESAIEAIRNSQQRVHSMSLIHQKLYTTDNLSRINIKDYITELIEYLRESFDLGQKVRFETCIEDIEMDVTQAVPIGLIINEAVTNSIKYAFDTTDEGIITVRLEHTQGDHFMLILSDNGRGLPQKFDIVTSKSLGMRLIKGLSRDLEAEFNLKSSGRGTTIEVIFIYDYKLPPAVLEG